MSDERIYPCDDCGVMRTKAEGGTIFTVCDVCWKKAYPHAAETLEDDAVTIARLRAEVETLRAERDAERARAEQAERERDEGLAYMSGYQADLMAVDRCLDAIDAPHHPEDGVSLSVTRIRELGGVMHGLRTDRDAWKATAEARPAISPEDADAFLVARDLRSRGCAGPMAIWKAADAVETALREHAGKVVR